jgi:hypothetical protein
MAKQCPQCRKISRDIITCDSCGLSFDVAHRAKRSFAETCLRIGVVITIAAGLTAFIAKLI